MTIDQHLQFSVLCAPIASFDRRALSQAWYSALYGSRQPDSPSSEKTVAQAAPGYKRAATLESQALAPQHRRGCAATGVAARAAAPPRGSEVERRTARSPLARQIASRVRGAHACAQKASVTIAGEEFRVRILLQPQGSRMKLIAICPARATGAVAAAVAQARYALAARGVRLDSSIRAEVPC